MMQPILVGAYDNANFFFHNGAQIPAYQKTETAAAYDRMAVVLEGVLKDSAVVLSGPGGNYTTTQNTTGLSPRQLKIDVIPPHKILLDFLLDR